MKHFYLLLVFISSIFTTSYAINSPVLLSPQANSTVTISSLSGFEANANEPTARKLTIKVMLNDPRTLVYQNSAPFATATEATTPVPFLFSGSNPLKAGQQYLVELKTESANGSLLKQQYFTFFTSSQTVGEPLLVKPAVNDTVYLRSAYLNYDGTTMTVNANEPRATRIAINVFHAITGEQVNYQREGAATAKGFATPAEATQNTELSMFIANLHHEKVYPAKIFLSTYASGGALLAQKQFNVFIKPRPSVDSVYALFTNPTEGQTGVSLQPTISLRESEEIEKHGIRFIITSYELDRYPADWQGEDYQKLVFNGGGTSLEKSWKPTTALKPGTKYLVQVSYTILDGSRYAMKKALLEFTTAPVSSKPLLISPKPDSVLYLVNALYREQASWTVNANDSRARSVTAQIFDQASGVEVSYLYDRSLPIQVSLSAATATQNVQMGSFVNPLNHVAYSARIVLTTKDSLGNVIGQGEYKLTVKPRPLAQDVNLTIVAPVNGQSNVALPVAVQVQRPDNIAVHGVSIGIVLYSIDRYPADWQGDDYQQQRVPFSSSSWQIPNLKPNITYELSIVYLVGGAANGNISGVDKTVKTVFTTAPAPNSNQLLLWPANNQTVSVCDSSDVLVSANNKNARKLVVKLLRNDPRMLVQEYVYTLADSTAAMQTIHIADVFGQLTANGQYLFEVKALDAWGGLLKQQYYTLFTSSCSSSSARMALQGAEIPQQSLVSPNPSTSDFQLRLHNGYDKATVEVVSMEGRIINQYKVAGNSNVSIKGSGLKPGLYLIRITGNAGLSEQFKIVKQ